MELASPTPRNEQIGKQITASSEKSHGSMFEPQTEPEKETGRMPTSRSLIQPRDQEAPEKKLTLFALRLALLEKAASGIGALGFIWATVVLLGGFAIKLERVDFWFVTAILLVEGSRIYSRSHELEWQRQSTSISDVARSSSRALVYGSGRLVHMIKALHRPITSNLPYFDRQRKVASSAPAEPPPDDQTQIKPRTWTTSEVPLLPYAGWVFVSKNISKLLYWLQLAAAVACVVLSLLRLCRQDYGSTDTREVQNRASALNIFYSLALAEASVFLMERVYWEWKVSFRKFLEQVNEQCGFGDSGIAWIRRFFYDAYSKCVEGSVFDGLKMDLLTFASELLLSNSVEEQLTGARMLVKFTENDRFSADAFRRIGTSMPAMERLVEMLSWRNHREQEIRKSAAQIVSKITGKKRNSLRVAGIPGALESISSLLHIKNARLSDDGILQKGIIMDEGDHEFRLQGLHILKKLANDHDNCGKIGTTRGLLTNIINSTHAEEGMFNFGSPSQIMIVEQSLKLVKKLVATTGSTGEVLRRETSNIVFTIGNLRAILKYGKKHDNLQSLAMDILANMALDKGAREKIGRTGGMLNLLFGIFFFEENAVQNVDVTQKLSDNAGEALVMLTLESPQNCERMIQLGSVGKLVGCLENTALRKNSARLLRNLCAYAGPDLQHKLAGIAEATKVVLKDIMSEEEKCLEVAIGLAAQVLRFTNASEFHDALAWAGTEMSELAAKLVQILRNDPNPSVKVPRMRRFVVELVITMMQVETQSRELFKKLELEKELKCVLETTSELECFNVFSGSVGLSPHTTTLHSLVDTAHELLNNVSSHNTAESGW
ncbi:uncharacterized protein LOC116264806 [Nymphaea colorata]|uniref:uncharacterized protein LOC116264806 n=1 Tax=Nymphaea colorata TaxID=210225 RepID=UPI00129E3DAA|nr:uncharacterized protein LOC116264806 [Nymphaea colorata]